jgi:hypothetical protein
MAELDENCNASPLSGCSDGQTSTAITLLTNTINDKLTSIISKKSQIVTDVENCTSTLEAKLQEIITKFQTIISNSEDCCEAITDNLNDIIDALEDKIYTASSTTTGEPASTTTSEPTTTVEQGTTTTGEPASTTTSEPTTTSELPNSATFYVDTDEDILCLEENDMILFYTGVWGVGTVMYTDVGLTTPLAGYNYIKQPSPVVARYNLNVSTGQVGTQLGTDCE